jgi:methyl-accepting chemotaxis protein
MTGQTRSLKWTLLLWAGALLLVMGLVLSGYSTVTIYQGLVNNARNNAISEAISTGGQVRVDLEVAMDTVQTLAYTLASAHTNGANLTRDDVNAILKGLLPTNRLYLATYVGYEPNAFDNKDNVYANMPGYDASGRFVPYWVNIDGNITQEPLTDYNDEGPGNYYLIPKKTLAQSLLDPVVFTAGGKDILGIEFTAPIIVKGIFRGITGIDYNVADLQKIADQYNGYGNTATMVIVSHNGTIVGYKNQKDWAGKSLSDPVVQHRNTQAVLDFIRIANPGTNYVNDTQSDFLQIVVPFTISATKQAWAVEILVPKSQITAGADRSAALMIVLTAAILLISLLILWFITNRITNPLRMITEVARSVSTGNLGVQAQVTSNDETGVLAQAFNQMIIRLRTILQTEIDQRSRLEKNVDQYVTYMGQVAQGNLSDRLELIQDQNGDDPLMTLGQQLNTTTASLEKLIQQTRETASNLSATSSQILAATSQQATGATEQAAAISQTSSTVEEVKVISEQFIHRAQEMTDTAQHSVDISRSGEQVVAETVASMDHIKSQVNSIAENILALSERTQQIGDIITTVNELASQSNILALNAAVEAARAGEHGKGFAVVAVEVRNLAEQSRQATAQVRTILLDIQKAINTTVMVTEEGTKVVEHGVTQAEQSGKVIRQLTEVIDQSSLLATQIVAGGRQQTTGIEQIAIAMQNIKEATVQGLASTRQTEKAVRDLNELAKRLQQNLIQTRTSQPTL